MGRYDLSIKITLKLSEAYDSDRARETYGIPDDKTVLPQERGQQEPLRRVP